jgi:putative holliday junction resolvase
MHNQPKEKDMTSAITRFLGIDYGTKRIGLALGDSHMKIAIPFTTVSSIEEVCITAINEGVDKLVIGVPLSMSRVDGGMKEQVELFAKDLAKRSRLPVIEIDERLSSKAADALSGKRDKSSRDAVAAMVILQTYLDKMN